MRRFERAVAPAMVQTDLEAYEAKKAALREAEVSTGSLAG
jgi:hypothetical protein